MHAEAASVKCKAYQLQQYNFFQCSNCYTACLADIWDLLLEWQHLATEITNSDTNSNTACDTSSNHSILTKTPFFHLVSDSSDGSYNMYQCHLIGLIKGSNLVVKLLL